MKIRHRIGQLAVLSALAACAAGPAAAVEPPVALALDVAGAVEPPVLPFDELVTGQTVGLGDTGRIEFLHYGTCQSVTVEGGDLSFSDQRFTVRGGRVVDMERAGCPTEVALGPGAGIAGAVLRSGGDRALRLGVRPDFVLVGARRGEWDRLRVVHDGATLHEVPLSSGGFTWPDDLPALEAGAGYGLVLLSDAGADPITVDVEIVERRGTPPPTLLRTD